MFVLLFFFSRGFSTGPDHDATSDALATLEKLEILRLEGNQVALSHVHTLVSLPMLRHLTLRSISATGTNPGSFNSY